MEGIIKGCLLYFLYNNGMSSVLIRIALMSQFSQEHAIYIS